MAATVVSVVIFLCGVLVGRGVRAERAVSSADAAASPPLPNRRPQAGSCTRPPPRRAPIRRPPHRRRRSTTSAISIASEKKTQPPEELQAPLAAAPTVAAAVAPRPAVAASRPQRRQPRLHPFIRPRRPWPPATAMSIQVAAVPEHDADTIARRLSSKGYSVFVIAPGRPRRRCIACASEGSRRSAKRNPRRRGFKKKSSSSPGSPAETVDRGAGRSASLVVLAGPRRSRRRLPSSSSRRSFPKTPSGTRT